MPPAGAARRRDPGAAARRRGGSPLSGAAPDPAQSPGRSQPLGGGTRCGQVLARRHPILRDGLPGVCRRSQEAGPAARGGGRPATRRRRRRTVGGAHDPIGRPLPGECPLVRGGGAVAGVARGVAGRRLGSHHSAVGRQRSGSDVNRRGVAEAPWGPDDVKRVQAGRRRRALRRPARGGARLRRSGFGRHDRRRAPGVHQPFFNAGRVSKRAGPGGVGLPTAVPARHARLAALEPDPPDRAARPERG